MARNEMQVDLSDTNYLTVTTVDPAVLSLPVTLPFAGATLKPTYTFNFEFDMTQDPPQRSFAQGVEFRVQMILADGRMLSIPMGRVNNQPTWTADNDGLTACLAAIGAKIDAATN